MARKKKQLEITTNSRIKSHIQRLWMWSRERTTAIRNQSNTCQICKRKGSTRKGAEVKTCVHHKRKTDWDRIIKVIREELLTSQDNLMVLCEEEHKKLHK